MQSSALCGFARHRRSLGLGRVLIKATPVANVRYAALFGLNSDMPPLPGWANNGLMQRSKKIYSITSSAIESIPGGTSMPSARAV